MTTVLIIGVTLLIAALLSGLAERTMLSTEVLFLVVGLLSGGFAFQAVTFSSEDAVVRILADIALYATLFSAGMRAGLGEIRSVWSLPTRALIIGMPLTAALLGVMGVFVAGLTWLNAFLVGAILSPTDPVFAEALVSRQEVPGALRHLLNIESGINDGLVLPVVVVLIRLRLDEPPHPWLLIAEVLAGVAIGVGVVYLGVRLHGHKRFNAADVYGPFIMFALAMIIYAICTMTQANKYLGAFAGGITAATVSRKARQDFQKFGAHIAELLKVSAIFVFGALVSANALYDLQWSDYLFAALAVFIARPAGFLLSMIGGRLGGREKLAAAWFGPKGFASVVYGLLLIRSGLDNAGHLFNVVAITVMLSILMHSSTDVLVAERLKVVEPE